MHSNQHSECTHGRSTATEFMIVYFHETKRYEKDKGKFLPAMLMSTLVKINVANSDNLSAIIIWKNNVAKSGLTW